MQRLKPLVLVAIGLATTLALLWAFGGLAALERQAVTAQRMFQNELAGAIRQLKAREPGAVGALLGIAFAYGVAHAAGPGHGKMLLGGYALATRVSLLRLAGIAIAASLAQATTAVVLVYAGVKVFGWTRERMVEFADRSLTGFGYAAIAAIGLWLAMRGFRGLIRTRSTGAKGTPSKGRHHEHSHLEQTGCGHVHGPTPAEIAEVRSIRDAAALIVGTAIRPCTGAVFLLILCWRIGADPVGIAGTYIMGLGTAFVTLAAALLAATIREGAWAGLGGGGAVLRVAQIMQVGVGMVLFALALSLLRPFV